MSQRHVLAGPLCLCICEFDHFFFSHLVLAGLVLLLSLWVHFSKQHRLHPRPPCLNFDTKDFHRLVFFVQTTRKSLQVERNLRWNSNKLKLVASCSASHHKLVVKRGTTMHKLKTCDDSRSRWIRAILWNICTTKKLPDFYFAFCLLNPGKKHLHAP